MMSKKRLDRYIYERYPQYSRHFIQEWIHKGNVVVDGRIIAKPGHKLSPESVVTGPALTQQFVSRAGYKLQAILDHCAIDVTGLVILDAGLSTGGFADCLLQKGAAKVYGVDVGTDQVHPSLRADKRLIVMEKTDVRSVASLVPELVDMVVLDLSFISVLKVISFLSPLFNTTKKGHLIVLIKPQFEVGRASVGRDGVVKDKQLCDRVVA